MQMQKIKLDPDQLKVASHYGSNKVVLAGAGSGKTATIIERGVALVMSGLNPNKMLMLTFTNKAAKEMKERMISRYIDNKVQEDLPYITTYHTFGFRLIKKYAEKLGLDKDSIPSIMNEKEANSEWINACLDNGFDKKDFKEIENLSSFPEILANEGVYFEDNEESKNKIKNVLLDNYLSNHQENIMKALSQYTEYKHQQNLLDFNDMILLPIKLLTNNPDISQSISGFLGDVVVDESQDNNQAQYNLLKLITDTGKAPTMMIGDADQAIYEWRGAKPRNITNFINEFNAETIVLERNYRSNNDIVQGAQLLVANNVHRIKKEAYSERENFKTTTTSSFKNSRNLSNSMAYTKSANAITLAKQIGERLKEILNKGGDLTDVSILYRSQRMGYFMDRELTKLGIPTVMMTGTGLMDRKEIMMSLAALRLAANPHDRIAFKRLAELINGFGAKAVDAIASQAQEKRISIISGKFTGLTAKQESGLNQLRELISSLKQPQELFEWAKENLIDYLAKEAKTKVKQEIKSGKTELNEDADEDEQIDMKVGSIVSGYLSNIKVIQEAIEKQVEEKDYQDNVWEVITDLSLDAPHVKKEKNGVKLSTIHSFKGLESEEVHIAGMTNGIMPLRNSDGQISNEEEERRLAYVALTRGKERVFIHHVENYDPISGGTSYEAKRMHESIYIKEIIGNTLEQNREMIEPTMR